MQLFKLFSLLLLCCCSSQASAFVTAPSHNKAAVSHHQRVNTRRYFDIGSMISNFGKKATVSHILIGPATSKMGKGMEQDAAQAKLIELKKEIDNDPVKFAEAAAEYSTCRFSSVKGGDLGTFGPGMMVQPVDKVAFESEVGKVHGPVSSPFGEHLIYVRERT